MRNLSVCLAITSGLMLGCGTPISRADGGAVADAGDSGVACPEGWWLDPPSPCDSTCNGQPEYGATDCTVYTFVGLRADDASFQGAMTTSATRSSLSLLGTSPSEDRWSVDASGGLKLSSTTQPTSFSCHGQYLDIGLVTKSRASDRLGTALDTAASTGTWKAVHY